jgi:hypothetical protein
MSTWLWYAGGRVIVRVAAADSDGRVSVWESEEPGGTALPPPREVMRAAVEQLGVRVVGPPA